jgi:hypothetical protein
LIARQGGHFPGGVCGAQRPGNVQPRRLPVPPSGSAVTHRIEMRRPCALGSTCASAATSFGTQRAAVAAVRIDGWLGASVRKCERMQTRSPRRRRVRLEGEPCLESTFALEPRPRACTPGAMDARNWSRLMCLETQGTRGGGPALVLDGMAERLTHNQLGSTYVSEVTRWACRWRRSASRCIPDGRSGRNVGTGTGPADMPEVRRE